MIEFVEVGRAKKTWTARISPGDPKAMGRELDKALMSRDIYWTWDPTTGEGTIYVGMNVVGTFLVTHDEKAPQ
jgi:hypothetical protein